MAGDAFCSPSARKWVLANSILASGMVFIDGTVVNVALPALQRAFDAGVAQAQWVVEAYALLLTALLLLGGSMGDRYGRRRVFAAGVLVFGAASILCGLAQSIALPAAVPAEQRRQVRQAVGASFVTGFRWVMAASALLAICSAVCAWALIRTPARDT